MLRTLLPLAFLAATGTALAAEPAPAASPTAPAPAATTVQVKSFEPKFELAAPSIEVKTREVGDGALDRKVASKAAKGATTGDASVMRAPAKPAIMADEAEQSPADTAKVPADSTKRDAGAR